MIQLFITQMKSEIRIGISYLLSVLKFSLISGASSGLGLETTRVLALRGVHVVMAVRNVDSGMSVKNTFLEEIPSAKIDVMKLDLSSMASVRKFAADYNSSGLPLNLLM